jgi:hypothetical protein
MRPRSLEKWVIQGALYGYLSSFVFFFLQISWSAWPDDGVDFNSVWFIIPFLLIYILIIYHVTGLFVVSAVSGLACGILCAWLEQWLQMKRRLALVLAVIVLTAPVASIAFFLRLCSISHAPVIF